MPDHDALIALQDLDSAIDQVAHRSARLPERAALGELERARAEVRQRRDEAAATSAAAAARIEVLEHEGEARQTRKTRLEQQLKTVIAPREAEALMAQIAGLDRERSDADDEELELIDRMETADAVVSAAEAELEARDLDVAAAREALTAAESALEVERAELVERRAQIAGGLRPEVLSAYEGRRRSFGGVAIARLVDGHCGACHLDLSKVFVEQVKHVAADGDLLECEQCGRWLVG